MISKKLALVAFAFVFAGCMNHPCRELRNPDLANATSSGATTAAATPVAGAKVEDKKADHVFVSKADGSLQCGMGKGVELAVMEKELKGIEVFSREKKNDGKMRVQLCGSPTGMLNIYEISAASLAAAEKLGFKKL